MPLLEQTYVVFDKDGNKAPDGFALRKFGPVITVQIHLPDAMAEALPEVKKEKQNFIEGLAIFDTGASVTCVDKSVAKEIGLNPIDTTKISHASGSETTEVYALKVVIPNVDSGITLNTSQALGVTLSPINNKRVIALIGRDLLSFIKFTYNGPQGRIELAY